METRSTFTVQELELIQERNESRSISEAIAAYHSHRKTKERITKDGKRIAPQAIESTLPPGVRLIAETTCGMVEVIKAMAAPKAKGCGRSSGVLAWATDRVWRKAHGAEADDLIWRLAYLTAQHCLDATVRRDSYQTVTLGLGSIVRDEIQRSRLEHICPLKMRRLESKWKDGSLLYYLRKKEIYEISRLENVELLPEDHRVMVGAGAALIDALRAATGWFDLETIQVNPKKQRNTLKPTKKLMSWLEEHHAMLEAFGTERQPMVVPPQDWTDPYTGGFRYGMQGKRPWIQARSKEALAEHASHWHLYGEAVGAINALQATPWRVNLRVLEVATTIWDSGVNVNYGMPSPEEVPVPVRPEYTGDEDNEEYRAYKHACKEAYAAEDSRQSDWIKHRCVLDAAKAFSQYEQIWFAWSLDWRGRTYPESSHLTPQGWDLSRGLLEFAEGVEMTDAGAFWLSVHLANEFGEVDKQGLEARVEWVKAHHETIMDCAADPMGCRWWVEADKPFRFLAACMEYADYQQALAFGEPFISHLPVGVDGSCNGLQNLCAMQLDEVGGAEVNLVPSPAPRDIYSLVAKRVKEIAIQTAAANDLPLHALLAKADALRTAHGHKEGDKEIRDAMSATNNMIGAVLVATTHVLNRKVVKQPVMTYAYSVTAMGMRDQIIEALKKACKDDPNHILRDKATNKAYLFALANFLRDAVFKTVEETVLGASQTMKWLQAVARIASEANLPIWWTVPDGLKVCQAYHKLPSKDVWTMWGKSKVRIGVREQVKTVKTVDKSKMRSGVAPNYTHSMDSCHLRMTVNACLNEGVKSFGMVHDSYATHASLVPVVSRVLREQFIRMYSTPVLAQLKAEVEDQVKVKLPDPHPQGTLDLQQVANSLYFFA